MAILAKDRYEARYRGKDVQLIKIKTLEQSQKYAYQQLYGLDSTKAPLRAEDRKDLNTSQYYLYSMLYQDKEDSIILTVWD